MPGREKYDAVIVGAGPNGLAAAVTLARAGRSVLVIEAKTTIGGGARTKELTLPGFRHDVCSAIHPMGLGSAFFKDLPLSQFGLEWILPPANLAHPQDDGRSAVLYNSVEATAETLGRDVKAYRNLIAPLVKSWDKYSDAILGPLRVPEHPLALARFGLPAILPATLLAHLAFKEKYAAGLFAGLSAHSILPLEQPATAAFGLVLGLLGHKVGWPIPKGGSQSIMEALAAYLRSLGGKIVTGQEVKTLAELPPASAVLLDVAPRQLLQIAGDKLPPGYRRKLERFRYGAGVFKLDYALDGPIPWKSPECTQAGTVHLGGTLAEIALSEHQMSRGQHPEKPYVLVAQQSLFDPTRAPAGKHTVWAYCHVPNGSTRDMTAAIENQLERFAPGFRDRVLRRHALNTADFEAYNPNYIGGDISSGQADILQLFTRPTARLVPYTTPVKGLYLCSSSTPPGPGVHGLCGYFAARAVLKTEGGGRG